MSEKEKTIEFQFPIKLHIAHLLLEILVYLSTLTPLFIVALLRPFFLELSLEKTYALLTLIGFTSTFILFLLFVYKRFFKLIPDTLYRRHIQKNISCPKCNSNISLYEKQYPRATDFTEYFYNCDFCKSKNLVEADDFFPGWRPIWYLSNIDINEEEIQRYKNIVENSKNDKEYFDRLDKELKDKKINQKP
jgi:hypothetical protein